MKKEKGLEMYGSSRSFSKMIAIYLLFCLAGILVSLPLFNRLIQRHDVQMASNVCNLIAEKMNNSIAYMTKAVENSAVLLGSHEITNMDEMYKELLLSIDNADYSSIGLIDLDNNIYGREPEKVEIEKWGLLELAENDSGVSISEPYRSSLNGKMVITMFSPVYKNDKRIGTLFATYPLEEIQNMANTNVLKEQTEIYLMNPYSDNFIRCSGAENALIGSWNNMMLYRKDIKDVGGGSYSDWEQSMRDKKLRDSVSFKIKGVMYAQVFESIDAMENWCVVVRIPSSALSNTLRIFQTSTMATIGILVLASVVLFIFSHKQELADRWLLEYASFHDSLTNVTNRRAFEHMATTYLDEQGKKKNGALLFMDVDYFKQVNDLFGHDIGDETLCYFAEKLKEVFAEDSIVARLGGDEFVVFVRNLESKEGLNKRIESLRKKLLEFHPNTQDAADFKLHCSIGISAFPNDAATLEELMQCADTALYAVKERGRNGYAWYDEGGE